MTNTTNSPVPSTSTGPVCGKCSTGFGSTRVQIRHASPAAVRECFTSASVPAPTVPAAEAPAPKAIKVGRHMATCSHPGCKNNMVLHIPFVLKCVHDGEIVRTASQQLVATVSKARCDSRCIHAVGATCRCSCAGRNHGVGNMNVAAR